MELSFLDGELRTNVCVHLCDFYQFTLMVLHFLCSFMQSFLWIYFVTVVNALLSDEVLVWLCLVQGADCLHMVQLMPLPSQNLIICCLI